MWKWKTQCLMVPIKYKWGESSFPDHEQAHQDLIKSTKIWLICQSG